MEKGSLNLIIARLNLLILLFDTALHWRHIIGLGLLYLGYFILIPTEMDPERLRRG